MWMSFPSLYPQLADQRKSSNWLVSKNEKLGVFLLMPLISRSWGGSQHNWRPAPPLTLAKFTNTQIDKSWLKRAPFITSPKVTSVFEWRPLANWQRAYWGWGEWGQEEAETLKLNDTRPCQLEWIQKWSTVLGIDERENQVIRIQIYQNTIDVQGHVSLWFFQNKFSFGSTAQTILPPSPLTNCQR